jgi:hypothetical protein
MDQSSSWETGSYFAGQNTVLVNLLKKQNVNYLMPAIVSYLEPN